MAIILFKMSFNFVRFYSSIETKLFYFISFQCNSITINVHDFGITDIAFCCCNKMFKQNFPPCLTVLVFSCMVMGQHLGSVSRNILVVPYLQRTYLSCI